MDEQDVPDPADDARWAAEGHWLADTPDDYWRKLNRLAGLVEDVKCSDCGQLHPLRKTNVRAREVELGVDYHFLCEPCCEERIHAPIRRALLARYEDDPERLEHDLGQLAQAAYWHPVPAMRERAREILEREAQASAEPEPDDQVDDEPGESS
ncbi:MAG: hypothetical protein ABR521_02710 [Gaiellaceae bacterium]